MVYQKLDNGYELQYDVEFGFERGEEKLVRVIAKELTVLLTPIFSSDFMLDIVDYHVDKDVIKWEMTLMRILSDTSAGVVRGSDGCILKLWNDYRERKLTLRRRVASIFYESEPYDSSESTDCHHGKLTATITQPKTIPESDILARNALNSVFMVYHTLRADTFDDCASIYRFTHYNFYAKDFQEEADPAFV